MFIKANSIARFITADIEASKRDVEECWKEILQYPPEGWGANESNTNGVLDPSLVIGRMFCNFIDVCTKGNEQHQGGEKFSFSGKIDKRLRHPISWLLRYSDHDWSSGQVLSLLGSKSQRLSEIVEEIRVYWPKIFEDSEHGDDLQSTNLVLVEELVSAQKKIDESLFFHISAPYFHKKWEEVLEKSGKEGVKEEDAAVAKQQWSMTVGAQMEKFINEYTKSDLSSEDEVDAVALQSGGGHVLLSVGGLQDSEKVREKMRQVLSFLSKKWMGLQKWSPFLKCTCEFNGETYDETLPESVDEDIGSDSIVEALVNDFNSQDEEREGIRRRWSVFGKPGRRKDNANSEECILYLDVIELSDKCWPKAFDKAEFIANKNPHYLELRRNDEEEGEKWFKSLFGDRPEPGMGFEEARHLFQIGRSREETREGFLRSRVLTSMIESTFGYILTQHIPSSIESMGGDEMTAKIRRQDVLEVYTGIEGHMQRFYSELVIDTESDYGEMGNIWWMGIWPTEDTVPDLGEHKDSFRRIQADWGGNFVVPMWERMIPLAKKEEEMPN